MSRLSGLVGVKVTVTLEIEAATPSGVPDQGCRGFGVRLKRIRSAHASASACLCPSCKCAIGKGSWLRRSPVYLARPRPGEPIGCAYRGKSDKSTPIRPSRQLLNTAAVLDHATAVWRLR